MSPAPGRPDRSGHASLPPSLARDLHEAASLKARLDLPAAIERYKKILAAHPTQPRALGGMGHALGLAGRIDAGRSMLGRALEIDPGSPELHHSMAELCALDIDPESALAHATRALESDPRRADSLTLGAQCLERLNRLDEARDWAGRAVAISRNDPQANLTLAGLETRAGLLDSARPRLEKLVSRSSTPDQVRHRAYTSLGMLLEKLGEDAAAFEAFENAGRELEKLPLVKRINGKLAYDRVETYRGRVTRGLVSRFASESFDTPAPAFLVGFPRSGTTMTEQILAAHPGVVTSDERPLLDAVLSGVLAGSGRPDIPAAIERLDAPAVARLRRRYWERAASLVGDTAGRLLVDKLPLNIIDLPLINAVFPDARVLVALRDPRDCCYSCFKQWFNPNPAMIQFLSLPTTVRFYEAVMGLYLECRGELSVPILEVRYEDTVADLETQGRRIIDHLGLAWDDALLDFHEKAKARSVRTPSYAAVSERVHTRAVGGWRRHAERFEPHRAALGPFVSAFGYSESV